MKKESKIFLGSLLLANTLYAQNTTVIMPYFATINYDSSEATTKDSGASGGIYFSTGNLSHLFELDYSGTNIKYKDITLLDLVQNDMTIAYSKYYETYMTKIGVHHLSTTDTDLGDGYTAIGKIGTYSWDNYDKYSYGLEGYYSYYKDGNDDNDLSKEISVVQFSPYYEFSKAINLNTRNTLGLKANYILSSDYDKKDYISYELENTLYYKKLFTTVKAYGGEMKSGVKDGGFTVYNTKDIIKDGYSIKVGYNAIENFSFSMSYAVNNFIEHGQTEETSNDVLVFSWNMNF